MNRTAFYLSLLTFALAFALYRGEDEMKCDGKVAEDDYKNAESLLDFFFCIYDLEDTNEKCRAQSIYDYVNPKIGSKYDNLDDMRSALCEEDVEIEEQNTMETACAIADDVKKDGGINKVIDPQNKCK